MKYFVRRDDQRTPIVMYRTGSDGDFYLDAATDRWVRDTDAQWKGMASRGGSDLEPLDARSVATTLVAIRSALTRAGST